MAVAGHQAAPLKKQQKLIQWLRDGRAGTRGGARTELGLESPSSPHRLPSDPLLRLPMRLRAQVGIGAGPVVAQGWPREAGSATAAAAAPRVPRTLS